MMDYEMFKDVMRLRIKDYLPSVYAKFEASIEKVPKINGLKDALIIYFETETHRMTGPNIYLDDLYEIFSENEDMELILQDTACKIMSFTGTQMMGDDASFKLDEYKSGIIKMMINKNLNKELLAMIPHTEYFDLAVTYRILIEDADGSGYSTALITNELMEGLGITLEELEQLAEKNSRSKLKTKVFAIAPDCRMMITEGMIFGGINLQRLDEIKKLADDMESDLYLLPSSIHDVMVIRATWVDNEETLFKMLRDGNIECNDNDEFLSDNIYYYNRSSNALEMKLCS